MTYEIKNISTRLHTIQNKKIIPTKTTTFKELNSYELAIVLAFVKKNELEIIKSPMNIRKEITPYLEQPVEIVEVISDKPKRGRKSKSDK